MPAGLDGWHDPVVSAARTAVLSAVVDVIAATVSSRERTLVGIDGRSGVGKSTFADEMATLLGARGVAALRSTTDSFHRPRAERMRRGPTSADGYYFDSHQLSVIVDELLEPFAGGASSVRVAAFDEQRDEPVHEVASVAGPTVLLFDGLFLQRPELSSFWDHTVYLAADARLDAEWLSYLTADLPAEPSSRAALIDERLALARWPRHRNGWSHYLYADEPAGRAGFVIDNNEFAAPKIVTQRI